MRFFSQGLLLLARKQDSNFTLTPDLSTGPDFHGHGTHTLSTVGGSFVKNVSAFGNVGDGQRKEGPLKPEWHLIEYAGGQTGRNFAMMKTCLCI